MPRTRSLAWAELKIGLISIFAVVMAIFLIVLLSGESGFFWQQYTLRTVFSDVGGLKPGAPIRVAGVDRGSVTDVRFVGAEVEVVMRVRRDMRPLITTDSVATLGSVSLLGEPAVDITASSTGRPLEDGEAVTPGVTAGTIGDVAVRASNSIEQLTALLEDVRAGEGTLGQLFTNDSLYRDLDRLVTSAETVARGISEGRGTLGRLATDPAAARALEGSLRNLEEVTARIRAGEGSLGQLLTDPSMSQSLTATTANLDAITGRISRGEGTAGAFLSERELYDRLASTAARLDQVTGALADGEGTAGQLLQDRQLYENMNSAITELRNLVSDIRADPRRYLNVRVSLF
jgi:phospholipid/cholesterol/gamma-HCH transport system substrate-binding protein